MTDTECRFRIAGAVRALQGRRLEVLAAPYGSPEDRDHLNEFFSAKTEFMVDVGDRRPALYFHGFTPDKKAAVKPSSNVIGRAVVSRRDDDGLWMEVDLKEGRLADRVWEAAEKGTCRASTGAVNYLCRTGPDGEVESWPIGELSLIDEGLGRHPVNDKAVALPLRAMFEAQSLEFPKVFGENTEPEPAVSDPTIETGVPAMSEIQAAVQAALAERAAMRAAMEKPIDVPVVMKEALLGADDKQQEHEFFWNMRHRNFERRTLDETQAAEGLGLMPIGLLTEIKEMASAMSFAEAAGMPVYQTNLHTINVPREALTPVLSDLVAEEGATSESADPAFAAVAATVTKKVDFVSVTEELLEDSTMLPAYFKRLAARKLALRDNLDVITAQRLAGTHAGVELATTDVIVKADLDSAAEGLLPAFRPGAAWFMHDTTHAYIQKAATLIAAPYNHFTHGRGALGSATLLGYPVYTDANWDTYLCGTTVHFMQFANLKYGLAKVMNPNIGVTVNPYTTKGTGWVRFYLGQRSCIIVTQPLVAFYTIQQKTH